MSIKISQFIRPDYIKVPLIANTRDSAIEELVDLLASNGAFTNKEEVLKSVLEREEVHSTGVGNCFAIPHAKCIGPSSVVMAIGKPANPVDFKSADGKPVSLIWLIVSPPDRIVEHIHVLAGIARINRSNKFRSIVDAAQQYSAREIFEIILSNENAI